MRPSSVRFPLACGLLVLAATALAPARAHGGSPIPASLERLEAGAASPVANRPHDSGTSLRRQMFGVSAWTPSAPYAEPEEYGITFEYGGMRADLERAGIRVQTQAGQLFTARVRRDEIAKLRAVDGITHLSLARYMEPHLNVSVPDTRGNLEQNATGTPPWYRGRAGKGILIGDVDTGIDYTSADFADSLGKTRILYIWDQNDTGGPAPSPYGYGTEWTKSQIDNSPGTIRHHDTNGHGTAVGGVLAGSGAATGCSQPAYQFVGMAPQASIVEVATNFSDTGIIDGVSYIFAKATSLGMDCVVNLSLGSNYGPHDGTDSFSKSISALTGPGRIVVASSGNSEAASIHGKLTTTSQTVGTDRFTFSIPTYTPASGIFNDYVLVTGWYDPGASLTIRVKGPNTTDTLSVGYGDAKDANLVASSGKGGKLYIANMNAYQGYNGTTSAQQFEIEVYDSLSTSAPRNGTWEIDVVSNNAASIGKRVDVWVYASTFGATALASTIGTGLDTGTMVGEPADGDSVIAVGSHSTKASWTTCPSGTCSYSSPPTLNAISYFSCIGPRRDGVVKPELTAPGFGVATTFSSSAGSIGSCPAADGVHAVTQGTSFSAPHVSGAVALFLMYQPHSSVNKVRLTFEQHARTDAFTGAVPNATWGYGKLDVYSTIDHIAPTCAVTLPIGGESWAQNTLHTITWSASDNVAVTGVNVAYSAHGAGGPWVAIANGIANSGSLPWTVPAAVTDSALVRVTALDAGGNATAAQSANLFHITASTGVPPSPAANVLWLAPPVPNPSVGAVDLHFSLARDGHASVEVYGVRGERVWSQEWATLAAGPHVVTWSGLGAANVRAGSGLYFVRLVTDAGTLKTRLVRLD